MLKYVSFDIVFREIPDEITLAINISGCPNRCGGCHSPWLWEDVGEILDDNALAELLKRYGQAITCVCFMGGDASPNEIAHLAEFVKDKSDRLKTGWYSGRDFLPKGFFIEIFDFIKLGRYAKELGGLDSIDTNQRLYRIENHKMVDVTTWFRA